MSSLYCLWGVIPAVRGIVYIINQQKSIRNHLSSSVCWRVSFEAVILITSWKRFAAGTRCERYRISGAPSISDGHSAHRWSTRRAAQALAKLIFLCCTSVPGAIFCVYSKPVSSLPSFSGKTPFDFNSGIVGGCGFCPCSRLSAAVLAVPAAAQTAEALTPVFTYGTRRQTCVSLYFLNIAFWGKLSAIISGVPLNLYFCSVECRCHLECKRELSEPSLLYLLSALTVTVYESLGSAIHYTFLEGLLNMRT